MDIPASVLSDVAVERIQDIWQRGGLLLNAPAASSVGGVSA